MRPLQLLPAGIAIPFIGKRTLFFAFSCFLIIASLALFAVRGLNYGIDFKGGVLIEVKTAEQADIGAMRSTLSDLDLGEVGLQEFGAPDEILIRVQRQGGGEGAQQVAVEKVKAALGSGVEYRRTEFVGP